jgi:ComEC/Rec2-related protein
VLALAALSGALLAEPLGSWPEALVWIAAAALISGFAALWSRSAGLALTSFGVSFLLLALPAPAPVVSAGVVRFEGEVTREGSLRPGGRYSAWAQLAGAKYVLEGKGIRPRPGEEIRALGYLQQPTPWQGRRGASGRIGVTRVEVRRAGRGLRALRGAVRRALSEALRQGAPRQHRLLKSVLLGGGEVRPRERAAFSATGTAHLLSISGLHVAILAGLALLALRVLGWSPRAQRWGVAALLVLYLILVGPRAPTLRATIAALAWLIAPGRSDGFNRLACALLVVVAWDPGAARSLGFQLSFGTVTGLILLGRCWRPKAWWARQVAGGVLAFFASSPLLAARLGQVPWAALWLGPPALALFSVILGLALVGAVLGVVHPTLGAPALAVADALAGVLVGVIDACAERFPADRVLAPSPIVVALGLGALALGAVRREAGRSHAGLLLLLGGTLCLSWTVPPPPLGSGERELRVVTFKRGAWVEGPGGLLALGGQPSTRERSRVSAGVLRGQRFARWEERSLGAGAVLYTRGPWRVLWVPRPGALTLEAPVDLVVTRLRGPLQRRRLQARLRVGASAQALVTCSPQAGPDRPIVVAGARPGG